MNIIITPGIFIAMMVILIILTACCVVGLNLIQLRLLQNNITAVNKIMIKEARIRKSVEWRIKR